MVGFGVVHDDVVDFFRRDYLGDFLEEGVFEAGVGGVDEGCFVFADDEVGVVGGAVWEWDEGVEDLSVPVFDADPVHVGAYFDGFEGHESSLRLYYDMLLDKSCTLEFDVIMLCRVWEQIEPWWLLAVPRIRAKTG